MLAGDYKVRVSVDGEIVPAENHCTAIGEKPEDCIFTVSYTKQFLLMHYVHSTSSTYDFIKYILR